MDQVSRSGKEPPRSLFSTLSHLGPGIIIAGSIVGSGELIATTKVGAQAGFLLLWLVILGCVIKVFAQVEIGRHTIIWRETPLQALDRVPGPRFRVNWIVWYAVMMTFLIVSQQGGIVGGVGQALAIARPVTSEGIEVNAIRNEAVGARVELSLARARQDGAQHLEELEDRLSHAEATAEAAAEPIDAYLWAVLVAVITSALLYVGRYGFIQLVATVLVALFTLVTILSMVLLQTTSWGMSLHELGQGMSLRLPPAGSTGDPVGTALAAFGIIGLGAGELLMYPYWCLEKGYARWAGARDSSAGWLKRARGWIRVLQVDAWLSMIVYTIATAAFYVLGAAVLWRSGLDPLGSDMIRTLGQMYVPAFGEWAEGVFLTGAIAILYSTFFVAAAGMSRLVADMVILFGVVPGSDEERTRLTRRISAVWPLVAVALFLSVRAPVTMVLASGTAQAIMLPMLGGAALFFRYRRGVEGLHPGRIWDLFLWISCIGFLLVAGWSVISLF